VEVMSHFFTSRFVSRGYDDLIWVVARTRTNLWVTCICLDGANVGALVLQFLKKFVTRMLGPSTFASTISIIPTFHSVISVPSSNVCNASTISSHTSVDESHFDNFNNKTPPACL